jgi:hypothetical protein
VAALALLVPAAAACGSDPDAQPPVASVDFEPRLVVTVDDRTIGAEPTDRPGAGRDGDGGAAWTVPSGSVVELTMDASAPHEVSISLTPSATADDPDTDVPWADPGTMQPGDTTVLALSATGVYRITSTGPDGGTAELSVEVVGRSTT